MKIRACGWMSEQTCHCRDVAIFSWSFTAWVAAVIYAQTYSVSYDFLRDQSTYPRLLKLLSCCSPPTQEEFLELTVLYYAAPQPELTLAGNAEVALVRPVVLSARARDGLGTRVSICPCPVLAPIACAVSFV